MPNFVNVHETASLLHSCDRILVLGCSASGKSTLSGKLSNMIDAPHISMDREVFWKSGWTARNRQEQREIIVELVKRDRWVMDGTNPSSLDIRLPRADLVIWTRMSRAVAYVGLAKRWLRYRGKVRPDLADGCPERFPDWEFLSYIWNFEKELAPLCIQNIDEFGSQTPVLVLRSHSETHRLLELAVVGD